MFLSAVALAESKRDANPLLSGNEIGAGNQAMLASLLATCNMPK